MDKVRSFFAFWESFGKAPVKEKPLRPGCTETKFLSLEEMDNNGAISTK